MISNWYNHRMGFLLCMLSALLVELPVSESLQRSSGSKVLIWPAENSHWLSMKTIAKNLVERGTEVTILKPSCYKDFIRETDEFTFINFNVTDVKRDDLVNSFNRFYHLMKLGERKPTLWETIKAQHFLYEQVEQRYRQCKAFLETDIISQRLEREKYDLVLSDPIVPCGEIIAAKLKIPNAYTIRISPGDIHFQCSQTPVPLSYVPILSTTYTDRMTFLERTGNTLTYLCETFLMEVYFRWFMNPLVKKYVGPEFEHKQLVAQASLWLIRTDFAFEYPRPLMPNVKFIGGLHCKPAKPLPDELEEFVNGSGEDGFIIFSMGTIVRDMHKSKSNIIASVFAKLRQRIVWRYIGERPDTLGSNTKIMSWIPQNDLLGHPKCRLFVTHGGTNGVYEAIYHGVPMLGIPLFFDQFGNMAKIKSRGAGKTLDITALNGTELRLMIEEMIKNNTYKENAMRLSTLHRDAAMTPLDSAIYWIEYVIRHKGAYHLRPAAHELSWFQYLLLDVIAFVFVIVFCLVWTIKKLRNVLAKTTRKVENSDNKSKRE